MLSNEDVSSPKPDPEIYQKAIAQFGLRPEECLIVEDNENGVRAAIASGAHVLVVRDTEEVNFSNIMNRISQAEQVEQEMV
jgi:beta-phosphoglucomutase-like phosphatase (HAD superfamily)